MKNNVKNRKIALIENDQLVINSWILSASEYSDIGLFTYVNKALFLAGNHSKGLTIYIDKNLEETSGLDVAQDLFSKGYTSLYITTGDYHEKKAILEAYPFIKDVTDKCFPN